jgi:dihydroorotase
MTAQPQQLTLRRPDDWHIHLRDDEMLNTVLPYTSAVNGRAIVMPNLVPPVTSVAAGEAYRDRILAALPAEHAFTPLMTCYLTDGTDLAEIERGHAEGVFTACKLYPAHATTNSAHGVTDIRALTGVLETLQRIGMPLLIHGEVTDHDVDIFDREAVFIERTLAPLVRELPELKVVFEHITTAEAAAFVDAGKGIADVEVALEGARTILIERFGEDPIAALREALELVTAERLGALPALVS